MAYGSHVQNDQLDHSCNREENYGVHPAAAPTFSVHSVEAPEIWLPLEVVGTEVVYIPTGTVLAYNLTAVAEADMWSDTVLVGTSADADKMLEGVRPELVETSD